LPKAERVRNNPLPIQSSDLLVDSWVEEHDREREIDIAESLIDAEHALVWEGVHVGRALGAAGLRFDPVTFASMRVLETSVEESIDSFQTLRSAEIRELIERSAALMTTILDGDESV
jgi:hypothetical protein